ncbi:hypothetical protein L596_013674 [Steinernema carpocapsae]|uniref:Uncharacterized protein n=1 Tax=Steinernema carpocapsae TaxID=34508 RepID=A0A4U5P0W3_STECR|nr:hypothetical protein L596_013674 [Steinernema carpocapsae]
MSNVDDFVRLPKHNLCVSGDYLYVVYSDGTSGISSVPTVVTTPDKKATRAAVKSISNPNSNRNIHPVVIRIHLGSSESEFYAENIDLQFPNIDPPNNDNRDINANCEIAVENGVLYLSGKCSLNECKETHISVFKQVLSVAHNPEE